MNETKWLDGADVRGMLQLLLKNSSERKLRLFAVACCQSILPYLHDERGRKAILAAESYADGVSTVAELRRAASIAQLAAVRCNTVNLGRAEVDSVPVRLLQFALHAAHATTNRSAVWRYATPAHVAACQTSELVASGLKFVPNPGGGRLGRPASKRDRHRQARLLRDIFGNPFRPVAFDSHWRTSDVIGLANAIYDDKVFERMPILADALMDAGCENEDIIGHCRGPGPHARGCWVVDLVLGKE
jgi:hypothetical protein